MSRDVGFRIAVQNLQLKCDAADCSHVEFIEMLSESDIGRACPLCGASILTAEDLKAAQAVLLTFDAINKAYAPPKGTPMEKVEPLIGINPHAGDIHVTIKGASL